MIQTQSVRLIEIQDAPLALTALFDLAQRPDRDNRILALTSANHLADTEKVELATLCYAHRDRSLNRYIFGLLASVRMPASFCLPDNLFAAATGQVSVMDVLSDSAEAANRGEAVKIIEFLPPAEQAACLRFIFDRQDVDVAREAHKLMALYRAPKVTIGEAEIKKFLTLDLKFGLQCIQLADNIETQISLLWQYYNHPDAEISGYAGRYIWTAYNYSAAPEMRSAIARRCPVLSAYSPRMSPLFHGVPASFFGPENEGMEREFIKDGSRLFLIGGPKAAKEIVREISVPAFAAWRKAHDAGSVWRTAGFDYVPVEPILDAELLVGGKVRVRCEVLDLPFSAVMTYLNLFEFVPMLRTQKHGIMSVLQQLGIDHGHPHNNNFCVRFKRHGETIDLETPPRLYLIDFDQARSVLAPP